MADRPLVIFGCGGHGRVVADASRAAGRTAFGFLDDAADLPETIDGLPLLGGRERLDQPRFVDAHDFVVAVGDCRTRRSLCEHLLALGGRLATVVHPSAVIAPGVEIGDGTVVVAGAVINTGARLGRFVVINTGATVDHDNVIEDGVHVSPGCHLAGNVTCRRDAFLGTGAVVIPRVVIGVRAVIAAGAVVTATVGDDRLAAGCPAEIKKRLAS